MCIRDRYRNLEVGEFTRKLYRSAGVEGDHSMAPNLICENPHTRSKPPTITEDVKCLLDLSIRNTKMAQHVHGPVGDTASQ